jgi:hypothetical protein
MKVKGPELEPRMQFDRAKLKTVILYTCARCDQSNLGAVKLNKVLYYADMLHYVNVGTPITGANYKKLARGPVCEGLLPILRELERDGALEIRDVNYFGYRKKEYHALIEPDVERLSKAELLVLEEVIDFVCHNNTAKTISEFSHNAAWEMAEFGEVIPYSSAFLLYPGEVSQEAMDWAAKEVASGATERPKEKALGDISLKAFRDRISEARRR